MANIRSLLVTVISMVVISFGFMAPSSATTLAGPMIRGDSIVYVVDFVMPDLSAIVADDVAVIHPDRPKVADNLPAAVALGPIYALSLNTDGQSLQRYHRRC